MSKQINYNRKGRDWALKAHIGFDRYGIAASTSNHTNSSRRTPHAGGNDETIAKIEQNWRNRKKILTLSKVYARLLAR